MTPDVLCIGSVLWDVIGRAPRAMEKGSDVPGRITRIPGGVALNIAMALRHFGLRPALLSAVGRDAEGDELVAQCDLLGLVTTHLYRSEDLPTDRYMAIEGAGELIAAIADAHSLEAAGAKVLRPLSDALAGWTGPVALDGNLTEALLAEVAGSALLAKADLRVAPASPGKAERLVPLLGRRRTTLYVNREEAGLIAKTAPADAEVGARDLLARGAARVLVTDGGNAAALGSADGIVSRRPRPVLVRRVTGAGDTFMAAHIAAEMRGEDAAQALETALRAAAEYVSGEGGE